MPLMLTVVAFGGRLHQSPNSKRRWDVLDLPPPVTKAGNDAVAIELTQTYANRSDDRS